MPRWVVLVPILIVLGAAWLGWPRSRAVLYSLRRERGKAQTLARVGGYQRRESQHFTLWYTDADSAVVDLVLEMAERVYEPVTAAMGYEPADRVPLILYGSREELRQAFGWGGGQSAVGVYWRGTIALLSPEVWIAADSLEELRSAYCRLHPLAHELTHYLLDYLTAGNYPLWFSEGLAQRIEYQVTGYRWLEPQSTLRQPLYGYDDLYRRFDRLSNPALAYRQSYLMVDFLVEEFGAESLTRLVGHLGRGMDFARALQTETGLEPEAFYEEWWHWVQRHLDRLEAAS